MNYYDYRSYFQTIINTLNSIYSRLGNIEAKVENLDINVDFIGDKIEDILIISVITLFTIFTFNFIKKRWLTA